MNEMRPAELAGSQLGSPGDEESMEEKRTCCVSFGACLCFPSLWKKGIYLLSSVPRVGSLLQPGHSVTHTCTRAHKHADVCTLFLPRYIIISSSLHRLSGALDLRGERRRADGRLIMSGGQFTRLHWKKYNYMHTIQCSSAVFRPQNNLKLCFHAGLKAKRQTCACVSTNVLTSKLQLYEMHTMFPLGLFVLSWVVLFFLPMRPSSISHFLFFLNFLFISPSFIIGSVVFHCRPWPWL